MADVDSSKTEKQSELERNSLYFMQISYILEQLAKETNPDKVLADILNVISTITGGEPRLAARYSSAMWEVFQKDNSTKKSGEWIPARKKQIEVYSKIIEHEGTYWDENLGYPSDTPKIFIDYLMNLKRRNALIIPLHAEYDLVLEVVDLSVPTHMHRYIDDLKNFMYPLGFAIQHLMLLQESQRKENKSNLLLDVVFHDIRNFISNIGMSVDLAQTMEFSNPEHKDIIEMIDDQSGKASNLMNRLKKVLRDSQKSTLRPCELKDVIRESEVTAKVETSCDQFAINYTADSSDDNPSVLADDLLHEVFFNVFTNAIKYTEQEEKVVDIGWQPWEKNPEFLHIKVSDYGQGIPDDKKLSATSRFGITSEKGVGLGLSIVMRLVERYGGYLWLSNRVEDDWKAGTTVNIVLQRPR